MKSAEDIQTVSMYIWHITFRYHENHFENMIVQSEMKDKIVLKTEYPTLKNLLFEFRPAIQAKKYKFG